MAVSMCRPARWTVLIPFAHLNSCTSRPSTLPPPQLLQEKLASRFRTVREAFIHYDVDLDGFICDAEFRTARASGDGSCALLHMFTLAQPRHALPSFYPLNPLQW